MTTNVFDGNSALIATDSRWSVKWSKWVVYVDDVPFYKIEPVADTAFMFAGKGNRIQEWKDWVRSNPTDDSAMPACEGMSVCMIRMPDGHVMFANGQDIVNDGAYFAGSGSRYAYVCWNVNRNAQKAIETAKEVDVYTGGDVKFFDIKSKEHNLHHINALATIQMVGKAIEERGNVMEISAGTSKQSIPFKMSEIAANDHEMQELKGKIASGEITPEAPCDSMYSEWNENQVQELKSALAKTFKWAK
jgi:hypothetical protein